MCNVSGVMIKVSNKSTIISTVFRVSTPYFIVRFILEQRKKSDSELIYNRVHELYPFKRYNYLRFLGNADSNFMFSKFSNKIIGLHSGGTVAHRNAHTYTFNFPTFIHEYLRKWRFVPFESYC